MDARGTFTGATLRAIIGLKDSGEVVAAFVGDVDGGSVADIDSDKADVWIKIKVPIDASQAHPLTGRLFIPANILFNLPADGESVTALRPAEAHGPGAPVVLHGDGGAKQTVPRWLDKSNAGISTPKHLHLESTQDAVDLVAASGKTVNANGTDYSMLKTEDLLNDLLQFFTDYLQGTVGGPTAQNPKVPASAATIIGKINSGAYKSIKAKNG